MSEYFKTPSEIDIEEQKEEATDCPGGLVICKACTKCVPNTLVCVYCGAPIKFKFDLTIPDLKPLEIKILVLMQSVDGGIKLSDISKQTDVTRKDVRICLNKMLQFGLVSKAGRGKYAISKMGETKIQDG